MNKADQSTSPPVPPVPGVLGYFTGGEWVIYTILVLVGLILRWTLLDMRPYHHDESLHGMYGRYFFDFPDHNYYKYDPMLHGPMLYNSMRFIYTIFGSSEWAARTPVAIMGSLFILVPLLFRRYFTPATLIGLTAAIALSPTLAYWSRFLREDYWVMSGIVMMLYGAVAASERWKSFWLLFGFTLQLCTKENIFVSLAVLIGYLIFEAGFRIVVLKHNDNLAQRMIEHVRRNWMSVVFAAVVSSLVYCWFYSAGFRYPEGILHGLGPKGFEYWMKHHAMERIEGPFNFHVYVLSWYELPFMLAFLTHLYCFYRRAGKEFVFTAGAWMLIMVGFILYHLSGPPVRENFIWKFFKLKDLYDLVGLFVLLAHSPIVTVYHLMKGRYGLAFFGYLFTSTFAVYSYLGEKVPWLSVYPLITGLAYLALFFQDYFSRYPLNYRNVPIRSAFTVIGILFMIFGFEFILEAWGKAAWVFDSKMVSENAGFLIVGAILVLFGYLDLYTPYLGNFNLRTALFVFVCLFSLRAAIQTNFLYAGKDNEYLSQVHTTYELHEAALRIKKEILFELKAYRPKVLVVGEATWPLTWYFRDVPEYKFSANDEEKKTFTYIFQDFKDEPAAGEIPEGFRVRKMNLRGWWVPDFSQMTLKKFLNYSINHVPWNGTGFTYTNLLTAKNEEPFKP